MSNKKINTAFIGDHPVAFYNFVNQNNYALLVALVGASNLSRVQCLEPECGTVYQVMERKKAYYVCFLIKAVTAGADITKLPQACDCNEKFQCACDQLEIALLPKTIELPIADTANSVDATAALAAYPAGTKVLGGYVKKTVAGNIVGFAGMVDDGVTMLLTGAVDTADHILVLHLSN